jgi:hypothetical protein
MDKNVYRALGRYTFVHFTQGRFRISGRILVLGQDDRDLVVTEIGVSPNVWRYAVPAPPQRRQTAVSDCQPQILFLGNPTRRKGLHDLIAALAMNPSMSGVAHECTRRRKPHRCVSRIVPAASRSRNQTRCGRWTSPTSRWRGLCLSRRCARMVQPLRDVVARSITIEAAFCVETLENALARHGKPEIFSMIRAASSPARHSPSC